MTAWGKKVSDRFIEKVESICHNLEIHPDWLMACMAFESGRTFRPDIKNMAGSGAVGLIQFMPSTAKRLGASTSSLAALTAEQQLGYVHKYFLPFKGRLSSVEDVYMAILWPRAIGKPLDYILFDRDTMPTTFRQNSGLDLNRDGAVTKMEASAKVREYLSIGLRPENAREKGE